MTSNLVRITAKVLVFGIVGTFTPIATATFADNCPGKRPEKQCTEQPSFREDQRCYVCGWDDPNCNKEQISCGIAEKFDIQVLLRKKNYDVRLDGKIGAETRKAIRDFQAKEGLEVNGLPNKKTLEKLQQ